MVLARLEKGQHILFNPKDRNQLRDHLLGKLKEFILTEEDISQIAREAVASKTDDLEDNSITETEAFRHKKKELKDEFEGATVAGFYLTSSLRDVSNTVAPFLLKDPLVEDVFASDSEIQKLVQESMQTFDESKIS